MTTAKHPFESIFSASSGQALGIEALHIEIAEMETPIGHLWQYQGAGHWRDMGATPDGAIADLQLHQCALGDNDVVKLFGQADG